MDSSFDETQHPRANGDGKFTEKTAADPGTGLLTPDPAMVSGLKDRIFGFPADIIGLVDEDDVQSAVRAHPDDLDAAELWLRRQGRKKSALADMNDQIDRVQAASRQAVRESVRACAHRILQAYPHATTAVLYNTGEGDAHWTFDEPDGDDVDWTEIEDDMWAMTPSLVLRYPMVVAEMCVGARPGERPASLKLDEETGELDEAVIDLTLFRA